MTKYKNDDWWDYDFPGIYKITCIINGKAYIGQSINIKRRMREHISRRGRCHHFYNAISKYGWSNFSVELLERINDVELLNEREEYWINKLNTTDKQFGYNLTYGGLRCDWQSLNQVLKNKTTKLLEKSVYQIDKLTKNVIAKYDSIAIASLKSGVSKSCISKCCKHRTKVSGGFLWEYATTPRENWKEYDPNYEYRKNEEYITKQKESSRNHTDEYRKKMSKLKTGTHHTDETKKKLSKMLKGVNCVGKPIIQINFETGEIINRYDSISSAAKKNNFNHGSISRCCNGQQHTAYGFKWAFL